MWLREPLDIEVSHTAVTPLGFEAIDDATNTPIDLTDMTLTCLVAESEGLPSIANPTVYIANGAAGQYDIEFDGADLWGAVQEAVTLAYEVRANDGVNDVVMHRGTIYLVPGVN